MKIYVLLVLFFLTSCSDGGGEGKTSTAKVTSGNIAENTAAIEYIQQSVQTLPPDLKISNEDKSNIKTELDLTVEESQSLDLLQ